MLMMYKIIGMRTDVKNYALFSNLKACKVEQAKFYTKKMKFYEE